MLVELVGAMRQRVFTERVRSVLADNAGLRRRPRQARGKWVDGARLALVGVGERRVFAKPERRQWHDYHVVLLLDCSGSMHSNDGGTFRAAVEAVHALAYALGQAGATVEVVGYNAGVAVMPASVLAARPGSGEARAWARGGALREDGDTRTHLAIAKARALFEQRGAPGRIMVELTDGRADSPSKAARELALARRAGVVCLGVGIFRDDVKEYYGEAHYASIEDTRALYPSLARLLERHVRRG